MHVAGDELWDSLVEVRKIGCGFDEGSVCLSRLQIADVLADKDVLAKAKRDRVLLMCAESEDAVRSRKSEVGSESDW